ncbi:MAG: NAD(P)H-dependent oxidoreductase [Lentisphaeria bacterium]
MAVILHLQASPRLAQESYSHRGAQAFLDTYRKANPNDRVVTRNVFDSTLPEFNQLAAEGKYAILHGQPQTPEQAAAWRQVEQTAAEFKAADKYVVSSPMWNFGIPHRLKQYLDVIVQPTLTFSFDPAKGYSGLVTGKPLLLVLARGSEFPPGSPMDFQRSYLEFIFRFIGFTDLRALLIEPTMAQGREVAAAKLAAAARQAAELAATF